VGVDRQVVTEVQDEHTVSDVTINENVTDDVLSQQSIIKHSLRDIYFSGI
jgi:uncharacterized protein YkvS